MVALPTKDVLPDRLVWSFIGPGGDVIEGGTGIRG
jgi:hypothetical protein